MVIITIIIIIIIIILCNKRRCCICKTAAFHAGPDLTKTKARGRGWNIYNVVGTEDR